ncbi:MAG: hypothetical protein V8S85_08025 [Oscillospiraceae bacterium]
MRGAKKAARSADPVRPDHVHRDFRRRGICAKPLAYAEKELTKRYFDCLTLVPAMDALRAHHETLGFVSQNAAFFDQGGAPEARGVCEVLDAR